MSDILGYAEILERVAERPPLLMLDRVELTNGRRVRGIKAVSFNEDFFQGHFPGAPVMPGVLQVAAMAQAAGLLLPSREWQTGFLPWLQSVHRIKFRKPVVPGDLLVVEAWIDDDQDTTGDEVAIHAQTMVDGDVTSQGVLRLARRAPSSLLTRPTVLAPPIPELVTAEVKRPLDTMGIAALIPHRYPFLLVDRVTDVDTGTLRIVGIKNITANEPFFAGAPIAVVPNYLQIEIAAQFGCVLAFSLPENRGKLAFFMAIDDATFHAPVLPGDQLVVDLVASMRSRFGKGEARMFVGDRIVTEVSLKFAIVDRNAMGQPA